MRCRHVAYGLELSASFALPGMAPCSGHEPLPTLHLDLATPAQLEGAWSGDGTREWSGRQGDGLELAIERGESGDLLFGYGDRARFLLDATARRLRCAPLRSGLAWQRTLLGKVIPAIAVMRGYEGLHAAAVDSPEGVIAIMAPSGSGKSTLAAELLGRGRDLFADDMLTLERAASAVRAHPGTPHMNLAANRVAALDPGAVGDTLGMLDSERWVATPATRREPRPVRVLCVLDRAPGLSLGMQELPATPLALAPYMLGLAGDPQRERARFELYCDLMGSCALVRLSAGMEDPPERLADLLEGVPAMPERVPAMRERAPAMRERVR